MSKRDSIQEDDQEHFGLPTEAEEDEGLVPNAQVIIHGRNVEVPEHFARRIKSKLARLERLDPSIMRFEVELRHEKNPRQSRVRDRIEITGHRTPPCVLKRRKIASMRHSSPPATSLSVPFIR